MEWKDLKACKEHGLEIKSGCLSCAIAMDFNLWRQVCHCCKAPVVGFRWTGSELVFMCGQHFEAAQELSRIGATSGPSLLGGQGSSGKAGSMRTAAGGLIYDKDKLPQPKL